MLAIPRTVEIEASSIRQIMQRPPLDRDNIWVGESDWQIAADWSSRWRKWEEFITTQNECRHNPG